MAEKSLKERIIGGGESASAVADPPRDTNSLTPLNEDTGRWHARDVGRALNPESVRDPESKTYNPTKVWYFYPPSPDIDGLATHCLPVDVFITASCWQAHQLAAKQALGFIQVCEVDKFGQTLRGSPYVAMLPVKDQTWNRIVTVWQASIAEEIEIAKTRLEQAELDLGRAAEAWERTNARKGIRVTSERIQQLQTLNCNSYRAFFESESMISITNARSPGQVQRAEMSAEVSKQLETAMDDTFNEHNDADGHED